VTPLLQMDKRKSNEEIANNLLKDCENVAQEISSTQPMSESGFNNSKSMLWGLSTRKFNENSVGLETKKRKLEEKEESPTKVRSIMNSEELNEPIEIKSTDTSIAFEDVKQSKDDSILEFNIFEYKTQKSNHQSDSEDDDICISFTPEKKELNQKSRKVEENEEFLSQKSNLSIQSSTTNHTKGNQEEEECLSQELVIDEDEVLSQQSKCSVVIDDDLNQTVPDIEPEVEFLNSPTIEPEDNYFFTPEEEEKQTEYLPVNDLPLDSDTEIDFDEDSIIQSKYNEKCSKLIFEFKERVKELHKNMCNEIIQQKQQTIADYPRSILYDFHIPSIFSFSPNLTIEIENSNNSKDQKIVREESVESCLQDDFTPSSPQRKLDSPLLSVEDSQPPLMTQMLSQEDEVMLQTQISSQETKKKTTRKKKKSTKEVEMPDYDSMSMEELKKTLSKFGVKGGKKKYMVEKLIQIFKATHPTE
jgi:hypothetical protein